MLIFKIGIKKFKNLKIFYINKLLLKKTKVLKIKIG